MSRSANPAVSGSPVARGAPRRAATADRVPANWRRFMVTISELDSGPQLKIAWAGHLTSSRAALPKLVRSRHRSRHGDVRERKIKDRVVGDIGEHALDHEFQMLADREVLDEADVLQVHARPLENVRPGVAEASCRGQHERWGIEPLIAVARIGRIVTVGN